MCDIKTPELVDARAMARLHPQTFGVPSDIEISQLGKGHFVKVGAVMDPTQTPRNVEAERFWVEVKGRLEKGALLGAVCNDLVFGEFHGLHDRDRIRFEEKNIYAIIWG